MEFSIRQGSFHLKRDGTVYFTFTTREKVPQEVLNTIVDRKIRIQISDEVIQEPELI